MQVPHGSARWCVGQSIRAMAKYIIVSIAAVCGGFLSASCADNVVATFAAIRSGEAAVALWHLGPVVAAYAIPPAVLTAVLVNRLAGVHGRFALWKYMVVLFIIATFVSARIAFFMSG